MGYLKGKWRCYGCRASGILSSEQMSQVDLTSLPENYVEPPKIDWEGYINRCRFSVEPANKHRPEIIRLTKEFNVGPDILDWFGVGWNGLAWQMPMRSPTGEIIGVSQRFLNGEKDCVEGSQLGLFIQAGIAFDLVLSKPLFVCEGFSDTVCVTDLGFSAIGRANADSCVPFVKDFVILNQVERVVVIADNDVAGIRGVEKLKKDLTLCCRCDIMIPGTKDIRGQIQREGKERVRQLLEKLV
jgi:5S rRNA maturation endonuclease (ribonuclease M5)